MFGLYFERRLPAFSEKETKGVLFFRKGKNFFKKTVKRERDVL